MRSQHFKPRSKAATQEKMVKLARHFENRHRLRSGGTEKYGAMDFKGRKLFRNAMLGLIVKDRALFAIMTNPKNINRLKMRENMAKYAMQRFGNNKQGAIEFLEGLAKSIFGILHDRKLGMALDPGKVSEIAAKKRLTNEQAKGYSNIQHITTTELAIIQNEFYGARRIIRDGLEQEKEFLKQFGPKFEQE